MNTTESKPGVTKPTKRSWRRHSDEFKARLVELALEPNASMASVALANGINANMLRRWVRASSSSTGLPVTSEYDSRNAPGLSFMQLPMQVDKPAPATAVSAPAIEVQIHRGQTRVVVSLPMGSSSAAWVREVLG